jgi:hypothetical protein
MKRPLPQTWFERNLPHDWIEVGARNPAPGAAIEDAARRVAASDAERLKQPDRSDATTSTPASGLLSASSRSAGANLADRP